MTANEATMKAVVLGKAEGKPGQVYHPIEVKSVPMPQPGDNQVLVRLHAAAMNHREVFIRQSLYPGIQFGAILGADGAGVVVSPTSHSLNGKAVVICPASGWSTSPLGPDGTEEYGILGGAKQTKGRGTFAQFIVVDEEDCVEVPRHLLEKSENGGWQAAAALPLAALTAYRATFTKAEVAKGHNVLITGIGGGVAIQALQLAIAAGARVYVTSGSAEKIAKAIELGAAGGVNYKDADWPKQLATLLPKDRPLLDSVIDSAGGGISTQLVRVLKYGAKIAVYGQTTGKPHTLGMAEVLRNVELRGSTMGSRQEFKMAIEFIGKHKIFPIVHTAVNGLENVEKLFETMKNGDQFGKLVVSINHDAAEGQKGKL